MEIYSPPGHPKVEVAGNVTVLTFTANAIRNDENILARELGALPLASAEQHLLLDFTNVTYINSIELATLITLHKRVRDAGGRLTLFNLSPDVFRVFAVTHLDTFLGVCIEKQSKPTALAHVEGASSN